MWQQRILELRPRSKGFHLVTDEVLGQLPELAELRVGILHLFIQHTSASLSINENADPTVRADMEAHFSRAVPENAPYYEHTLEGPDDMPSHIKMALTRTAETIPVTGGQMALGTWQGIFLWEHRRSAHRRRVVLSAVGKE